MKRISRVFLFGAVTVILLAAACAPTEGGTPIVPGALQDILTGSPTALATDTTGTAETTTATVDASQATATNTSLTPSIPVTGLEVISLDCQYCVDNIAHAQLVIPRDAKFEVVSPEELASRNNNDDDDNGGNNSDDNGNSNGDEDNGNGDNENGDRLGCRTIDRFRDKKLVLCRAEENTIITLNVCLKDDNTCTEVEITLQSCALTTGTPSPIATISITPTGTLTPGTITATVTSTTATATSTPIGSATSTSTPTPTVVTNTPTASPTSTPTPTSTSTATSTPTP